MPERAWILNALVPPVGAGTILVNRPLPLDDPELLELVREKAKEAEKEGRCLIGHPATAALLGVKPSRGEATPVPGDVAYVIRLRRRRADPTSDIQDVEPKDLELRFVEYRPFSFD